MDAALKRSFFQDMFFYLGSFKKLFCCYVIPILLNVWNQGGNEYGFDSF